MCNPIRCSTTVTKHVGIWYEQIKLVLIFGFPIISPEDLPASIVDENMILPETWNEHLPVMSSSGSCCCSGYVSSNSGGLIY